MAKTPKAKSRSGRFQVSIWSTGRDEDSLSGYCRFRVCIQHSRYNRQQEQWENQSIWCSPEEVRDLHDALDKLSEQEPEEAVESHGEPALEAQVR